jgi:DNA polymerase-3 subunit delta
MPPEPSSPAPLCLICGEDDFSVKQHARKRYARWTEELGGMDHEIIEATASNGGEAVKVLGRLRESLQTLPFFGSGKAVWLKDCNFLGDDRVASSAAVTEALADLVQDLKSFEWRSVRLLISAGKVDKRKTFFKTVDKLGEVEVYEDWSGAKDWVDRAEALVLQYLKGRGKQISDRALAEMIARIGPNPGQMQAEAEKVSLFVGDRTQIEIQDVEEICSRNKTARAYAVGEALGDRNLPRLLKCLDEELWEVKLDPRKSEIGLLYGLISKVRSLLLLNEMIRQGWIRRTTDYNSFKAQLSRLPTDELPQDRRYNPLSINSYVLFKALPQAGHYSEAELVRAMEILLECNRRLVTSGLDETLVLQQALVQIVGNAPSRKAAR